MNYTFPKPYQSTNLYTYVTKNVSEEPAVPIFYTEQRGSRFFLYCGT